MYNEKKRSIFVFGSNLAGRHGGGAARDAVEKWGAVMTVGIGLQGNSYAIPTKDYFIKTLPLKEIEQYVNQFKGFAEMMTKYEPNSEFLVTRIGCGLAGYSDGDIAPMFDGVTPNCLMPEAWREITKADNFGWDKDFDHGTTTKIL